MGGEFIWLSKTPVLHIGQAYDLADSESPRVLRRVFVLIQATIGCSQF